MFPVTSRSYIHNVRSLIIHFTTKRVKYEERILEVADKCTVEKEKKARENRTESGSLPPPCNAKGFLVKHSVVDVLDSNPFEATSILLGFRVTFLSHVTNNKVH